MRALVNSFAGAFADGAPDEWLTWCSVRMACEA
jgi:hypothetical protein